MLKTKLAYKIRLHGSQSATYKTSNHEILKFVINYIKETGRFDRPLFCQTNDFLIFFKKICQYLSIATNFNSIFTLWGYL